MSTARSTPLHDEHVALGASMTEFGGWMMPLRYGSDIAEHTAVRSAAGLFDLSHMGEIEVSGPGAGAALDHALVGWLSTLDVGRARYSMIAQEDGAVLDDLVVYRTAPETFLVVANAGNAEVVHAALEERVAGLDAEVRFTSPDVALVAVQGPRAAEILLSLTAPEHQDAVTTLRYYAITPATVAGTDLLVARTGYTGEDGFELFVENGSAVALWRALLAAGEPLGLVPAGLSARDSLRLEAGMPLYGHELDLTTTPYEAGLGRVVRLDKTDADGAPVDFVGRAALEARSVSEPARVLVGLKALGRRPARAGYPVVADATTLDRVVGSVTSGAPSPTLGYPVALAYVTPEHAAVGTRLAVDVRGRGEAVEVVETPFYRRQRG
jgi:aminomethyltransferase